MTRLGELIKRLTCNDDGQDLIEYAMLVGLIALAAVVAVNSVGSTVNAVLWQAIASTSF